MKGKNEVVLEAKAKLEDEMESLQSKVALLGTYLWLACVAVHVL